MISYGAAHWRALASADPNGQRVLLRQVTDGDERWAEIAVGRDWVRLKDTDRILPLAKPLPQTNDAWIR